MRWLVRIMAILVAVVVLIVGALLLMPGDKIASLAAEQIRAQTGRDLQFDGDVRVTFWPVLGIETGPVTLGNASWASDAPMLTANALSIGVAAAPLLSGDVQIKRLIAEQPVLRLEEGQGRANWEFGAPLAASGASAGGNQAPSEALGVTLDRLSFDKARLIYVRAGETVFDFDGVDLAAKWPDPSAPLELDATLPLPHEALKVSLTIPDLPGLAAGQVVDMEMSLNAPETSLRYAGKVSKAGELSGQGSFVSKDTTRMLAVFDRPGTELPRGLGRAADVSAQITYTKDGRLSLRTLDAKLDGNRLKGDADLVIGDVPTITARLDAGTLDLTGLAGEGPSVGEGGSSNTSGGWSTAPIDASALSLANGSIALTADAIKTNYADLGPSRLTLSLDRRRAVLTMQPVTLFSGLLTGELVANNRNGLSVGGNLVAEGIDAQQSLSTFAGVDRLSGLASGTLRFLGVGQTEDQIMRSLSGEGRLQMGRGVISGLDLDGLMGTGAGSGGTTVFNSLTASFQMEGGNAYNSDLLMLLENFKATGEGRIGLGAQDLDYLFTPVALRANSGQGLAVPVRIVGPWRNPSIRPDLSQALEAAAGVEVDALEDQAKDELRQKLGEELDTTISEDQDIEELIKDRLEDEAKKGLLKLFGVD